MSTNRSINKVKVSLVCLAISLPSLAAAQAAPFTGTWAIDLRTMEQKKRNAALHWQMREAIKAGEAEGDSGLILHRGVLRRAKE